MGLNRGGTARPFPPSSNNTAGRIFSLQNKATMDGCLVQGWPGYSPERRYRWKGLLKEEVNIIIISSSIHNTTADNDDG